MADNFELRDYQIKVSDFITSTLDRSGHAAFEAPTGSGKTIIGLHASITYARAHNLKIVYLTRTNSQQDQVINELRILAPKLGIKAVGFQGRYNLCPLYREVEGKEEFSSDSLSRFCNSRKKKVIEGNQGACRFFNWKVRNESTMAHIFSTMPKVEEFSKYAEENTFCPYESLKHASTLADLVIMPYAYFLNRDISDRFLARWGVSRDRIIVVMDEAHNLMDAARDISSYSLNINLINLAEREAKEAGDPMLLGNTRTTDICEALRNAILDLVRDLLKEREEAGVRYEDFRGYVATGARIRSDEFEKVLTAMYDLGESICDMKEKDGRVPRSHILNLAARILIWSDNSDEKYIQILSREKEGNIESYCIEPDDVLRPLMESFTIHMSGTLEPFDAYRNITGFGKMEMMKLGDIFPAENRLILYDDSISTKFDELDDATIGKICGTIESLVSRLNRKTAVFFPSYRLMERIIDHGISLDPLIEEKGMKQNQLMALISRYRRGKRPLFAVIGGRISEGINFPGDELQVAIIVGIPYPKPDAKQKALQNYYEHRFKRGWEYAVTFPVAVKLRQAVGRLIRSRDDTGVAIILDRRASYFRAYIPGLRLSRDPVADSEDFFHHLDAKVSHNEQSGRKIL